MHITIVSDVPVQDPVFDHWIEYNLTGGEHWKLGLMGKIEGLIRTPYEQTVFLDTDTYVVSPVSELFKLLAFFDFCLAMAPADLSPAIINGSPLEGLSCYNTGVIAFRKNLRTMQFLSDWEEDYSSKLEEYSGDQPSFMRILTKSDIKVHVLQQHYNARTNLAIALPGAPVKILHGRHRNFVQIAERINRSTKNRHWCPIIQDLISIGPSFTSLKLGMQCLKRVVRGPQ